MWQMRAHRSTVVTWTVCALALVCLWGPAARHRTRSRAPRLHYATPAAVVQAVASALDRRDATAVLACFGPADRADMSLTDARRLMCAADYVTTSRVLAVALLAPRVAAVEYEVQIRRKSTPPAHGAARFVAIAEHQVPAGWYATVVDIDAASLRLPAHVFPGRAAWNAAHLAPFRLPSRGQSAPSTPTGRGNGASSGDG